ncbi:hypothetical protein D3C71_1425050 [compost metagenome]
MFKQLAAFSVLASISCACAAADDLYTSEYSSCIDDSGGVTVEILNCIAAEFGVQDARLNGAYKRLGSTLTPSRKTQLTSAQRLWVQYRDANCDFYADPEGGTLAGIASNDCVLRETAERAKELETLQFTD